jgi:hypothetical protein
VLLPNNIMPASLIHPLGTGDHQHLPAAEPEERDQQQLPERVRPDQPAASERGEGGLEHQTNDPRFVRFNYDTSTTATW